MDFKPITAKQMQLLGALINEGYVVLPSHIESMSMLTMQEASELIKKGNDAKGFTPTQAVQQQQTAKQVVQQPMQQQPMVQQPVQQVYDAPKPTYTPKVQAMPIVPKQSFSGYVATKGNKLIANAFSDRTIQIQVTSSIVSLVSANPDLNKCDYATIVSGAIQGATLKLAFGMGYFYLVPFKNKKKTAEAKKIDPKANEVYDAQFQLGYKGYLQLAMRSGQYKNIDVLEVREGELAEFSPLYGQKFNWIKDYNVRKNTPVIGYVAFFELINGFKKEIYVSYDEMLEHADTYSQAFDKNAYERIKNGEIITDEFGKDMMWKYSSFWYKNFDDMAKKTMLRKLLSKWGILSIEMQDAFKKDHAVIGNDGEIDYIDSPRNEEFTYGNTSDVNVMQEQISGTKEF